MRYPTARSGTDLAAEIWNFRVRIERVAREGLLDSVHSVKLGVVCNVKFV